MARLRATDKATIRRRRATAATGAASRLAAGALWELIAEDGEVVGAICPDCLTRRRQRAVRAEKARVIRRLERGLPL